MPKPVALRDQMRTAVQLGIPDLKPSSARPANATPTKERLALAEELLRNGSTMGAVAEETGLSRHLVRVIANCLQVEWHFVVPSEDWELEESRKREAVKWQARQARKKAVENQ